MPQQRPDVQAAGAVVTRKGGDVLLVHRPRYDDWSFPKGKVDRGERWPAAAVREVGEETGLRIRLGPPLASQRYPVGSRTKHVHYWVGRVIGDDDVSGYEFNKEIDDVRWVSFKKARAMLTYDYDHVTLDEADGLRRKTAALIVLRHAKARKRKAWRADDRLRPLLALGTVEARKLVPVLAAYDPTIIQSSSSVRCVQTVAPFAEESGWMLGAEDGLSEEGATTKKVVRALDQLMHSGENALICTHRPVLPTVFDMLGIDDVKLEPGTFIVVHHLSGEVVATEKWPR